jgi:predicted benzoate:H+ symporter BenE
MAPIAVLVRLALPGPRVGAPGAAVNQATDRYPALLAFAASVAGVSFDGIGAVFRGVAAELHAHDLDSAPKYWRTCRVQA